MSSPGRNLLVWLAVRRPHSEMTLLYYEMAHLVDLLETPPWNGNLINLLGASSDLKAQRLQNGGHVCKASV